MHSERTESRCCQFCNVWKPCRTVNRSGSVLSLAMCAECVKEHGYVWKEGAGWVKK